jgi:hypothetical protein
VATLGDKYQINPVDGYIVLKLAPRSGQASYGIVRVRPANDSSPMFAKGYSVVRGRELPTFHAIRGQVTYVGALSFEESGDDLRLSIEPDTGSDDVRMVAQYMARTYPKVRAKVAVDALRMVARTDGPSD